MSLPVMQIVRMNKKVYIISIASLIAILVLVLCAEIFREGGKNGPSVSVPGAVCAKCISIDTAPFRVTVDEIGVIYLENEQVSAAQLEEVLSELDPRDCWIKLRVDGECPFGKLEPVLAILENKKIGYATFSVYEK